jgi:Bacterial dipeptidyl-peptidase Sh3 domain
VIASHYAEPLSRYIGTTTALRGAASEGAPVLRELASGEPFQMIDDSVGWAWGYAGKERRVGYVRSSALTAQ